jgi:hypothetical protein
MPMITVRRMGALPSPLTVTPPVHRGLEQFASIAGTHIRRIVAMYAKAEVISMGDLPVSNARSTGGMSAGRIVLVVFGALAAVGALLFSVGGGVLLWAHATQRDAEGFYTTSTEQFSTPTFALTSRIDLGRAPGEHDWTIDHPVGTVRIRATSTGDSPLFVGIGPQSAVDTWLAGVAHERVTGANFGPFHSEQAAVAGNRTPALPLEQTFWAASASGRGEQTLRWASESGQWSIVVMNADARQGVTADVNVGAKTGILLPIGIGFAAFAFVLFAGAAAMLFFGLRHQTSAAATTAPASVGAPGSYPARLSGHLDPNVSRWLWLVKWVLVIPHVVVLAFLWIAVVCLTVVAGFAILFTGRYPRSIFDFNVGVMRWTWRVSFYGLSALATDQYPPFTLRDVPEYPATFSVDYPEHLSRGLVLVKWWLLAIPHYLIVAVLAGGWGIGWTGGARLAGGGGLIAILAVIAAVVLLVRGRYPDSIFDFVMGLNRWCYRVLAYVALMRDEYPPFRFDGGGLDPGTMPAPPAPTPEDGGALLDTSS